jgi:predicted GNAT family acetyltransferase
MRPARRADTGLLVRWADAFTDEALPVGSPGDNQAFVRARLDGFAAGRSGLFLWEDGGRPVSLVGFGGSTPNGARVGPVYTPPPFRRRGYASALTAAVSAWLLDHGRRECFLYTDLANPTSNAIYAAIGYEPVCDSKEYRFEAATTGAGPAA